MAGHGPHCPTCTCGCTCGYGGQHEPGNADCNLNHKPYVFDPTMTRCRNPAHDHNLVHGLDCYRFRVDES